MQYLSGVSMSLKITNTLPKNDQTVSFYETNDNIDFEYNKSNADNLLLCSYNVHGWVNINANINYKDNFKYIVAMLSKINADILVLQEVCLRGGLTETHIYNEFNKLGYTDYMIVPNGGCHLKNNTSDYLMVFGKKSLINKVDIDCTNGKYTRHCAIIEYDTFKIANVHLEIGDRFHHLSNDNVKIAIQAKNANLRINQLNEILYFDNSIDIFFGDFNFIPNDPESIWLRNKNYIYYGNDENTTPYNRTDMLFANNKINIVNNVQIVCNYSDHLPVVYELSH